MCKSECHTNNELNQSMSEHRLFSKNVQSEPISQQAQQTEQKTSQTKCLELPETTQLLATKKHLSKWRGRYQPERKTIEDIKPKTPTPKPKPMSLKKLQH
ncbi:hypothetical protein G9A89_023172 [Geosiphon pyriformis]|nr:hypothetical protein G9A89_023172 [Geosiphon pyriformis]